MNKRWNEYFKGLRAVKDGDDNWATPDPSSSKAPSVLAFKSHNWPKFPRASHDSWHSHFWLPQVGYFRCSVSRGRALVLSKSFLPSRVGVQTLVLLKICFYHSVSQFLKCKMGKFFQNYNFVVLEVAGRGWLISIHNVPWKANKRCMWSLLFVIYWSLMHPKTDLTSPAC